MLDVIIRNGTVVDGTGRPSFLGDVGIRDDRLVFVGGTSREHGRREFDATSLVVAPGFVDIHTHYDAQLFWDPGASPSPQHGFTTVFGGNCGFSLAPSKSEAHEYLLQMMARVEGIPTGALASLPWNWDSFEDWLSRLEGRIAVNAGFFVGHSALRRVVMDEAADERAATEAELGAMKQLLHESLTAGALGFSSSRALTHTGRDGRPVPSRLASDREILMLSEVAGMHDGTALELILPGCFGRFTEQEMSFMTEMSVVANRALNWNVLPISAPEAHRLEHQLSASTYAAERGGAVFALVLPYVPPVRVSFESGFGLSALPGWADVFKLRADERIVALSDPAVRQRLETGARSAEGAMAQMANWPDLVVYETVNPANASYQGLTVGAIAARTAREPFDALLDIVSADRLRSGVVFPAPVDDASTQALRAEVVRDRRVVIGGSDAGAHLDIMCGAAYSTALLKDSIASSDGLSLEETVKALSLVPAQLYGLRNRGCLLPGWFADVTVFDPATVGPQEVETRNDLPGANSRVYVGATGMRHVFVNGVEILANGGFTGAVPGVVIRSGIHTATVTASGPAQS